MTQEDKELLLKDLGGRLRYGVILQCCEIVGEKLYSIDDKGLINNDYDIEEVKPYLFPLSSMTPKQKAELAHLTANIDGIFEQVLLEIEFYHRHHIDYKGLIEKGLAIDATNLDVY